MKKDISIFDSYFEPQIIERGIGYYFNDLVKDIKKKEHCYSARIEGTRIYNVELEFNDKEDKIVKVKCNCPYSVDREKYCKHIYALLYALKGEKIDNRPIKKTKYTPPSSEVVDIKCPNCGSNLKVDSPSETIECMYCHSFFALDIRLIGKEKRLKEILDQADLYYEAEDFREAYYEYAKAYALDKDNKYIKYFMNISAKRKNIDTNVSINDYDNIYDDLKEAFKEETEEKRKKILIQTFMNLLTAHANHHLNRIGLSSKYFWKELDTMIDYYISMLKELDLSKELIIKVYDNYMHILKLEIEHYDAFSANATNPKEALQKAVTKIEQEVAKLKK